MKHSPLARKTPLRRKSRIKAKPPRRLKGPGSDPAYLAAVRALPCCAVKAFSDVCDCLGPIDPHHAGNRPGVGMKAADDTCIPMCRRHHREVETLTGSFRHWDKAYRRLWYDARIAETREAIRSRIAMECGL